MKLLHTKNLPIFEQLKIEEALLRTDTASWCIINEGSPEAIVMGISGDPDELIDRNLLAKRPIPVIRRFSGGGTVLVEEHTLFVTFILAKSDIDLGTCPKRLLHWTDTFYGPLFSHTAFAIRENDYAIEDKKVGGNAQYFAKNRTLHHTSFLWDFCPEAMQVLKMPNKVPEYRQGRTHSAFLTKLCHYFSSKGQFVEGLKIELQRHFEIEPVDADYAATFCALPHRTSTIQIFI